MRGSFKAPNILPGFWPAFSYTILYLSLMVLIPLSAVFLKSVSSSWEHLWKTITAPNVVASYRLSFVASLTAGLISVAVGFLIAWVFISFNIPIRTVITPLLIVNKLEQYDYAGATAIAVVMLLTSFVLLLGINILQKRARGFMEAN